MVADSPVDPHLLAQLVEVSATELSQLMAEMASYYEETGRGFELSQVAGGYRFQSHHDMAAYVERFVLEGQHARLSAAAMETLAIIAYKQPISRAQVAAIRGVNVDGVCRTLEGRGYIAEVARDPGPGQAVLFGTTDQFLERMGINAVEDLPPVADFVPGAEVVEALEHGLRVEVDESETPEPDAPPDRAPALDHGIDSAVGESEDRGPDPSASGDIT